MGLVGGREDVTVPLRAARPSRWLTQTVDGLPSPTPTFPISGDYVTCHGLSSSLPYWAINLSNPACR